MKINPQVSYDDVSPRIRVERRTRAFKRSENIVKAKVALINSKFPHTELKTLDEWDRSDEVTDNKLSHGESENPFLDENGDPYHDYPEREY
jgi:uncharacterized protein YmfQ (DUF2313 family)